MDYDKFDVDNKQIYQEEIGLKQYFNIEEGPAIVNDLVQNIIKKVNDRILDKYFQSLIPHHSSKRQLQFINCLTQQQVIDLDKNQQEDDNDDEPECLVRDSWFCKGLAIERKPKSEVLEISDIKNKSMVSIKDNMKTSQKLNTKTSQFLKNSQIQINTSKKSTSKPGTTSNFDTEYKLTKLETVEAEVNVEEEQMRVILNREYQLKLDLQKLEDDRNREVILQQQKMKQLGSELSKKGNFTFDYNGQLMLFKTDNKKDQKIGSNVNVYANTSRPLDVIFQPVQAKEEVEKEEKKEVKQVQKSSKHLHLQKETFDVSLKTFQVSEGVTVNYNNEVAQGVSFYMDQKLEADDELIQNNLSNFKLTKKQYNKILKQNMTHTSVHQEFNNFQSNLDIASNNQLKNVSYAQSKNVTIIQKPEKKKKKQLVVQDRTNYTELIKPTDSNDFTNLLKDGKKISSRNSSERPFDPSKVTLKFNQNIILHRENSTNFTKLPPLKMPQYTKSLGALGKTLSKNPRSRQPEKIAESLKEPKKLPPPKLGNSYGHGL